MFPRKDEESTGSGVERAKRGLFCLKGRGPLLGAQCHWTEVFHDGHRTAVQDFD